MIALATYSTGDVMLFAILVIVAVLLFMAIFHIWRP